MRALGLVALLVYTFGAFAYGAILFLWVTHVRSRRWAARDGQCAPAGREGDGVNGVLLVVSLLWFCCNVGLVLFRLVPLNTPWQLDVASVCLAFAFPPIIMHIDAGGGRPTPIRAGVRRLARRALAGLRGRARHSRVGGDAADPVHGRSRRASLRQPAPGIRADRRLRGRRRLQHRAHRDARRRARAPARARAAVDARALRVDGGALPDDSRADGAQQQRPSLAGRRSRSSRSRPSRCRSCFSSSARTTRTRSSSSTCSSSAARRSSCRSRP